MLRTLTLLILLSFGACAAPSGQDQANEAAERDAALHARLDSIQVQLEHLVIQSLANQQATSPFIITPPLHIGPRVGQSEQDMKRQKAMIDALMTEALEKQWSGLSAEVSQPQPQLPTLIETDFGPGFVPASPEITIKEVDGDTIILNVSQMNPIGGPSVHHYQLKKVDGVWVGTFLGSTEYL